MNLKLLRCEIDRIDSQILTLLKKRFDVAQKIGQLKKKDLIRITDSKREMEIIEKLKNTAAKYGIDKLLVEKIFRIIISHSKKIQKDL